MVALGLPANVSATADGSRKLFNKWSYEEVEVKDISLQDYIQIRQHVYLPHTAGRFAVKRFRKAQVNRMAYLRESVKTRFNFFSAPSLSV
jgi:small subunit ribosomal protein S5e